MTFDDPIWLEAIRLIRKFFPESRGFVHRPSDLQLDSALDVLKTADPSLERVVFDPLLENSALCRWVLDTASFSPSGRAVVVPDCGCPNRIPFVCDTRRLLERVDEDVPEDWGDTGITARPHAIFDNSSDTFITFESGEAFLVDHEGGACWARSRTTFRWASESVNGEVTIRSDDFPRVLFYEYGTQLTLESDGSLVLNVLCGRIGEYGVEFELNDDERQQYRNDGDRFVGMLSREVQNDPKRFGARGRYC